MSHGRQYTRADLEAVAFVAAVEVDEGDLAIVHHPAVMAAVAADPEAAPVIIGAALFALLDTCLSCRADNTPIGSALYRERAARAITATVHERKF